MNSTAQRDIRPNSSSFSASSRPSRSNSASERPRPHARIRSRMQAAPSETIARNPDARTKASPTRTLDNRTAIAIVSEARRPPR